MRNFLLVLALSGLAGSGIAQVPIVAPQAASCISSSFSATGDANWKTITLKITNSSCGQDVDFQNSTITFLNKNPLNTNFWGNFAPLTYPTTSSISSQPQTLGNHLASIPLQFPTETWANTKLPQGKSFAIIYSQAGADYVENSVQVYLSSTAPSGNINLINATAKPANASQPYAVVGLSLNGQSISSVQVPWSGQQLVSGLSAGTYTISPVNITDNQGTTYQGKANPKSVVVANGSTISSTITYAIIQTEGKINMATQALPDGLNGYTGKPQVTLTGNGSSIVSTLNWNTVNTIGSLVSGTSYTFATPAITYNGYNCTPAFSPSTATAANSAPTVTLSWNCKQVALDNIRVKITGAPATQTSVKVTFTPASGTGSISRDIALTNGGGTDEVQLSDGLVYTVSVDALNGYSVSYTPQPLTASANAVETITYTKAQVGGGRVMAYMPGWKTPPPAADVAKAGYTHILVAFGVFSSTTPGQIVPAFDTINTAYIQSLKNAGIKVILSLGGASTSLPNTTVDFHQVLSSASSSSVFVQQFIQSMENLKTQYGFDGFDIDIEHGLNGGGTFANPAGDIAVMANILNTMKSKHPEIILSMAPQIANIAATSGFDGVWGNYASLVMQTWKSLDWVGIQIYNSGCAWGIDLVCYDPNNNTSPNTSVAMATDLLENWPATTASGQKTGFQPYISYLKPSQVVLGYPAPDNSGISDGLPAANTTTIKRALQCLRTAVAGTTSCDTYIPPRAYPGIGGVFEWEITYDARNNYAFATQLTQCVIQGNCS